MQVQLNAIPQGFADGIIDNVNDHFRHWAGIGCHGEGDRGNVVMDMNTINQAKRYQVFADFRINDRLGGVLDFV